MLQNLNKRFNLLIYLVKLCSLFLVYRLILDNFKNQIVVEDWSELRLWSGDLFLKEQNNVVMPSDERLHRSHWAIAPSM